MKNNPLSLIITVIFFGALWGILEATLGYALQFLPAFFSGLIMFPIATGILTKAYQRTSSQKALLMIGVVAATIKSVNLFMPIYHWRTINPMVAIILETLLITAVVMIIVKRSAPQQLIAIFGVSYAWRTLYLLYMGAQMLATGFVHQDISSVQHIATFILIHGSLSAGIAFGVVHLSQYFSTVFNRRLQINPITAVITLVIAVALTLFL